MEKKVKPGPAATKLAERKYVREARDTEHEMAPRHGKGENRAPLPGRELIPSDADDRLGLKTEVTGAERVIDGSPPPGEPARSSAGSLSSTKAVRPSSPRESERSASPPQSPRDQSTTQTSGADNIEKRQEHHNGVLPGLKRIGK
jgi:hypothetical protein